MKDPKFLSHVQDTVWADPRWKAKILSDKKEMTFCNEGALAVANGVGCHEFDPPVGGEPYLADQLWYFFQRKTTHFLEKDLEDAQDLANHGSLIFAILPSWILQEAHGHICSITPGSAVHSEAMGGDVPVCLNISTTAMSSRLVGINWAFPLKKAVPKFYGWIELL